MQFTERHQGTHKYKQDLRFSTWKSFFDCHRAREKCLLVFKAVTRSLNTGPLGIVWTSGLVHEFLLWLSLNLNLNIIYVVDTVIMNTTDADERSPFDGCLFFQAINEFQSVRSRSFDALG